MLSARTLRITLLVLATVGTGWAAYLTYVHYSGEAPVCSLKGDPCAAVQKSVYSELAGVPVALIGAIGYLFILGTLIAGDGERARFATAALTLGGFAFSVYLTYREVFTLHKICEDCVASAVIMTILMCLSVWRFLRTDMLAPLDSQRADAGTGGVEAATPLGSA
ncbi:MAG TPA: vitamin K epoxide reductase family protein [Solirubrobacteraceae bacterium]|nr:vitamin K epoxide reductase family protein [Solirubrobacteraceae bacterium]